MLHKRAFTLLELIAVLVILAILATLAVPTFTGVIRRATESTTKATLSAIARDAQALHGFEPTTLWRAEHIEAAIAETPDALGGVWAEGSLEPVAANPSNSRPQPGQVLYFVDSPTQVFGLAMLSGARVCALAADASRILALGCADSSTNPAQDVISHPENWTDPTGNGSGGTDSNGSESTPPAPLGHVNISVSGIYVTFEWAAVPKASSYVISDGTSSASTSSTSFTFAGSAGKTYNYQISSSNSAGTASPVPVSVTLLPDAPTNVTASMVGKDASVSWEAPEGATSYEVYLNGSFVGVTMSTSMIVTPPAGASSAINVKAKNAGGTSGPSETFTISAVVPPEAPVLSASGEVNAISMSWAAPSENGGGSVDYYKISLSNGATFTTSETSYRIESLPAGEYSVSVQAHNAAGFSPASNSIPVMVTALLPPPASALTAQWNGAKTQVSTSWAGASGATDYTLRRQGYSATGAATFSFYTGDYDSSSMGVDSNGFVYVEDRGRIRKISPSGAVTTTLPTSISGIGTVSFKAVTVTPNDKIYAIAGYAIYQLSADQTSWSLFAGSYSTAALTDGAGAAARFNFYSGAPASAGVDMAADNSGNLYALDPTSSRYYVRKITSAGVVSTLTFEPSSAVAIEVSPNGGSIYVASTQGGVTRYSGSGYLIQSGIFYQFALHITEMTRDSNGNLYLVSGFDGSIYKIATPEGTPVTTISAPTGMDPKPNGITTNSSGTIFIAGGSKHVINKVSGNTLTTFAGTGADGNTDNGVTPSGWMQIYQGPNLSYIDTPPTSYFQIQYSIVSSNPAGSSPTSTSAMLVK